MRRHGLGPMTPRPRAPWAVPRRPGPGRHTPSLHRRLSLLSVRSVFPLCSFPLHGAPQIAPPSPHSNAADLRQKSVDLVALRILKVFSSLSPLFYWLKSLHLIDLDETLVHSFVEMNSGFWCDNVGISVI